MAKVTPKMLEALIKSAECIFPPNSKEIEANYLRTAPTLEEIKAELLLYYAKPITETVQ